MPNELSVYQTLYDKFLSGAIDSSAHRHDLGSHAGVREDGAENICQIMWPSDYIEHLSDGPLHQRALLLAQALLGDDVVFDFDMLIFKPPLTNTEVPPHQDRGYWPNMPDKRALSIWVAMDDATEDNGTFRGLSSFALVATRTCGSKRERKGRDTHGTERRHRQTERGKICHQTGLNFIFYIFGITPGCMGFAPGSHRQPMREHRPVKPGLHVLQCDYNIKEEGGVQCPIRQGSCTLHDGNTIHFTGGKSLDKSTAIVCVWARGRTSDMKHCTF